MSTIRKYSASFEIEQKSNNSTLTVGDVWVSSDGSTHGGLDIEMETSSHDRISMYLFKDELAALIEYLNSQYEKMK